MTTHEYHVDPFARNRVLEWLESNGFKDYEGHGIFEHGYSLSFGYVALCVHVMPSRICAGLYIKSGDQQVHVGDAYTVGPIAALWGALSSFDYENTRDAMFWRDYHERRYPMGHRRLKTSGGTEYLVRKRYCRSGAADSVEESDTLEGPWTTCGTTT